MKSKLAILFLDILATITFILTLSGCENYIYFRGLENFRYELSSDGTTETLIPKGFLTRYEYVQGDFFFYATAVLNRDPMDKTLLYVEYSDTNYKEAKEYIMTEMNLNIAEAKEYNGYTFYLNNDFEPREIFPFQYTMAGYNDEKNRLIFLGMVCAEKSYPDVQYGETDFGLYLEIFFGEWYDFDA